LEFSERRNFIGGSFFGTMMTFVSVVTLLRIFEAVETLLRTQALYTLQRHYGRS